MNKTIQLKVAANYVEERTNLSSLNLHNFVTVDNLLQNKEGRIDASGLPPKGNSFPGYKTGDILIGNIRPYLKKIWFANCDGGSTQDVLILRANTGFDPKFLFYALFRDDFFVHMMNGKKGTKMPRGDKNQVLDFLVPDYDLPTQERIADVLSSLDVKIELNNRINAELEAMAKTLYDYWFVQFDFPDKNNKPYKKSGGKMVWSSELKREIPEGWEVKSLFEITDVSTEQTNPFENPEKYFKHYSIPAFDAYGTYIIEKGKEIQSNKFNIKSSDILVSKLNPWFNRVVYARDESDTVSSTEFVVWRSHAESLKNYLYMISRDQPFISYCSLSATGTSNSHKRINPDVMMKYKIPYNHDLSTSFGDVISSTIKKLSALIVENNELKNLRDWLLPMLMNGQVKVMP